MITIKTKRTLHFFLLFILTMLSSRVNSNASAVLDTTIVKIPVEEVIDKIRGGLLGEMLGNLNGLPHEFQYFEQPGGVKNYVPSLPNGAWTDDDTDVEWLYIYEMEKRRRVFLSSDELTSIWEKRINDRIWNANRYARYLMDIGIKPPITGKGVLNPWSIFNISGMFCSETFGLVAPAMPRTAAKIGLNYTTVAISGEPAQQTQLFTTMVSTAFIESDINKIIDSGVAALDPNSVLVDIINDVRKWHKQYPNNWRETRKLLLKKYLHNSVRDPRDNNGYELATGFVITALLYGNGNFSETVKIAFNLGLDSDCDAATAGTILGVVYGYRKMMSKGWMIVDRYKNTSRDDMPMDETITSFADRIIRVFEMVNKNNGGSKTVVDNTLVYRIPIENPAPIINIQSLEEQKESLKKKFEQQIINNIRRGNRVRRARAAYMAVCLEMNKNIEDKYPKDWEKATFDLRGYWKIMTNIFYFGGNKSNALNKLRKKFIEAGIKKPDKNYSSQEIWHNPQVWINPVE